MNKTDMKRIQEIGWIERYLAEGALAKISGDPNPAKTALERLIARFPQHEQEILDELMMQALSDEIPVARQIESMRSDYWEGGINAYALRIAPTDTKLWMIDRHGWMLADAEIHRSSEDFLNGASPVARLIVARFNWGHELVVLGAGDQAKCVGLEPRQAARVLAWIRATQPRAELTTLADDLLAEYPDEATRFQENERVTRIRRAIDVLRWSYYLARIGHERISKNGILISKPTDPDRFWTKTRHFERRQGFKIGEELRRRLSAQWEQDLEAMFFEPTPDLSDVLKQLEEIGLVIRWIEEPTPTEANDDEANMEEDKGYVGAIPARSAWLIPMLPNLLLHYNPFPRSRAFDVPLCKRELSEEAIERIIGRPLGPLESVFQNEILFVRCWAGYFAVEDLEIVYLPDNKWERQEIRRIRPASEQEVVQALLKAEKEMLSTMYNDGISELQIRGLRAGEPEYSLPSWGIFCKHIQGVRGFEARRELAGQPDGEQ